MRLAAVNPRIDFNLDSMLAAEVSIGFCLSIFPPGFRAIAQQKFIPCVAACWLSYFYIPFTNLLWCISCSPP